MNKKITLDIDAAFIDKLIKTTPTKELIINKSPNEIVQAVIAYDEINGEWSLLNLLIEEFLNKIVPTLEKEIEDTCDDELSPEIRYMLMAYNLIRKIDKKVV